MANTFRVEIETAQTLPDTSGNVWAEPASISQPTNDRYPNIVFRFKDTATKDGLGGSFTVPKNFVGSPKIYAMWTTTATSGNAIWNFDYTAIAAGETLDPSADQESLTVTTAAPGTTQLRVDSSMSITAANLAVDDIVQFKFSRNGAGSDTIAADLILYKLVFEYQDA